jgi:hypothetical protein
MSINKILFYCIFSILSIQTSAQNSQSLSLAYNNMHIGQSLSLSYDFSKNKHQFSIQGHYFLNKRIDDFYGHLYKDRFHGESISDKIGLGLQYGYKFRLKNSDIDITPFYSVQFYNLKLRNYFFNLLGVDSTGSEFFLTDRIEVGNLVSLNNILGLEISTKVYKNIFFVMKGGNGVLIVFNDPTKTGLWVGDGMEKIDIQYVTGYLSIGIKYKFR